MFFINHHHGDDEHNDSSPHSEEADDTINSKEYYNDDDIYLSDDNEEEDEENDDDEKKYRHGRDEEKEDDSATCFNMFMTITKEHYDDDDVYLSDSETSENGEEDEKDYENDEMEHYVGATDDDDDDDHGIITPSLATNNTVQCAMYSNVQQCAAMCSIQCAEQNAECSNEHTVCSTQDTHTSGPSSYQESYHLYGLFSNQTTKHRSTQFCITNTNADDDADADDDDGDDHMMSTSSPNTFHHWCVIEEEGRCDDEPTHFKNFTSSKSSIHKDQYRNFLEECKMAFRGNRISVGCHFCDKSITTFATGRDLNSFYLKSLVKFTKNEKGFGGSFVYSRQHKPSVICLPNGIRQAAARLNRFSMSLESMPSSAMYLNHGLATAHLNGRSKWMSDYDQSTIDHLQLHVCPLQCVKKLNKGASTVLRLTQAANSLYRSLCIDGCPCRAKKGKGDDDKIDHFDGNHDDDGDDHNNDDHKHDDDSLKTTSEQLRDNTVDQIASVQVGGKLSNRLSACAGGKCETTLSLNDTIEDYAQQLPAIADLALSLRLSLVAGAADVEKYFTQIKMDDSTSFRQAALVYRCWKSNLPTFSNTTEGRPNEKQVLIPTNCAFGLCDLSQCAQACSDQIAGIFETHLREAPENRKCAHEKLKSVHIDASWILTENWESKFYYQQCDNALKTALYIDDFAGYITIQMCISFLQQKSLHSAVQCNGQSEHSTAQCTEAEFTTTDFAWSDETLMQTASALQLNITAYTVLALEFTGFNFKSFDGCSENIKNLNDLIKATKPVKIQPDFEKPPNEAVRLEHLPKNLKTQRGDHCPEIGKGVLGEREAITGKHQAMIAGSVPTAEDPPTQPPNHPTTQPPNHPAKIYLSQLGVDYYTDETCSQRSKSIKLKSKRGQPVQICHSIDEYDRWLQSKNMIATKRDIAAVLGQYFSQNLGLNHVFPTLVIKFLMASCSRDEKNWDWSTPIPANLLHYLRASIRLFFLSANSRAARCNLNHSMNAINILIGAGDASGFLHSTCHFIIQKTSIGNSTQQQVQLLSTGVYLSKASILSIVYYECVALCKTVARSVDLFHLLNKVGLHVHPHNVVNLTDSSACCFMSKSAPNQLEKKYAHLISKICMHLLSIDTCPQQSIHFFSQTNRKRATGQPYVADVISKVPPALSEDELVEALPALWTDSVQWMSTPVEKWSFITNFPKNVKLKDTTCHQFTPTNATIAHLCRARLSLDKSSFQVFTTLPVSGISDRCQTGVRQLSDKCQTDVGQVSDKSCRQPITNDDNFHHLMRRKLSQVHLKGSAFNILALCTHYLLKLKKISKLDCKQKQLIRAKLKEEMRQRTCNFTPFWPSCFTRCGLVSGLSCGNLHHITKQKFFGQLVNLWPHFGTNSNVPAKNIMSILKDQLKTLSDNWSNRHQAVLTQYVFSALAAKQMKVQTVKNTARLDIALNSNHIYIAIGRKQGTILDNHQLDLGYPLFRVIGSGVFALSIIRYFHLKSDHNRRRAKLAILKAGFICAQLENILWEAELCCQECRLRRGMNVAKNSGLYTPVSGTSFNLASVAFHSTSHTFATDCWGPMDTKDGVLHGILFVSLLTNMCYSYVLQDMGVTGVLQAVQCLSAITGNVTCVISDNGTNFTPFAEIFNMSEFNSDDEETELRPAARRPRNPLARLLGKTTLEGNNGGIAWKLICAQNHSQCGIAEVAVKIIKRSLRNSRFHQQCKDFDLSKVAACISIATTIYNTRAIYTLEDGECYSPFDVMCLTTVGASAPRNELQLHSDSVPLKTKFNEYKQIREEIQLQIFQHYCKFVYLASAFKERGKFHFRSDRLQPGDLVVSKAAFLETKNITKSIRRIHKLNHSKRQAVVYHTVESNDKFDSELFNIAFRKCRNLIEKQKLVKQYFGRFSYQSIDLREVTFLCGRDTENLELSMRRSRHPESVKHSDNPISFSFENLHQRLKSNPFTPSVKAADLPLEAGEMLMKGDDLNLNLAWKEEKEGENNIFSNGPPHVKLEKPKLALKCAEPESIIVDLPNVHPKRKPKNKKSK